MATTKQATGGLFTASYTPTKTSKLLPNGDKQHGCGCITYWGKVLSMSYTAPSPAVLYRKACGSHKGYANRLCLVAP